MGHVPDSIVRCFSSDHGLGASGPRLASTDSEFFEMEQSMKEQCFNGVLSVVNAAYQEE
jgi:hypothetical protein